MSTQVLIAHSGQRLQTDPTNQFASVEHFKAWVSRQCRIPAQDVVALTPSGKTVKSISALQPDSDIFVYDMRIISASSSPSSSLVSESPMPKRYVPTNAPDSIANAKELRSWQDLFRSRRAWALEIHSECSNMVDAAQTRYGEMDVIMRCLDAAVVNLETAIKPLDCRYNEFKKWVIPAQEEYAMLAAAWERYLSLARKVPVSSAMVRFMMGTEVPDTRKATLEDLVDATIADRAGRRAASSLKSFNAKVTELDDAANKMFQGCQDLFREFDIVVNQSALQHSADAARLLQDMKPLVMKISSDCQTVIESANTSRDISQASKMAAAHTRQLLPRLSDKALEMDGILRYATEKRNTLASGSLEFMRIISEISVLQGSVKSQMNTLSQGSDEMRTFDILRLVQQLPFMYATYVCESIRRREWTDKMKQDSATLANEMALFQDEEIRRRRKWQKTVGSTYGHDDTPSTITGLEVNLRADAEAWPSVTKEDLQEFSDLLRHLDADADIINDVEKLLADLSAPTRQQTKRLKAFKNGSIHKAALGRSGLLIRGDNDLMQSLQEDKLRLESKVKTAESRVRRLEALLHQHSQTSRTSSGGVFPNANQNTTERNGSTTSVKSPRIPDDRRTSLDGTDLLVQTVRRLEAELAAEKQKSAEFEADLNTRTTQHNTELEEVNSTKKDLLSNMEALKREFDVERKSLDDEIKQLKSRIEDHEDEMEHFGQHGEHEKTTYEHVKALLHDIDCLRNERNDNLLRSQGQVQFLRNESRLQRERNNTLDGQLQACRDTTKALTKKLEVVQEQATLQMSALRNLHAQLSSGAPEPADAGELIETVPIKATELLTKLQDVERDVSLVKSDLEHEQATVKQLRSETLDLKCKLAEEVEKSLKTKELLSEKTARVVALEGEVAAGREQMSELRAKLSDGETGSESLRKRLEEEEARISNLTEDLATKKSQLGSLGEELLLFKENSNEANAKLSVVRGRLERRTEHAKDLTQRLYAQNDRLCRLLERLGFSVTRQEKSMVIQKIPRAARATMQNAGDSSDPNNSIRKSTMLKSKPLADSADLELLHWMNNEDISTEEEKYEAYLQTLGEFDMELFSETVHKRMKDVEHIARKLQRDLRSSREKAHSLQKEGHEKIAYKNFKEGDLALFLPTRNQTSGAWAAFNVGFPHYFLREQEQHRLRTREWLVARISRVQERVVDLSKSLHQPSESDSFNTENDNPFDLSDGLRWYLIDAHEDKPGAPSTPGPAKSTVATNTVDAVAERRVHSAKDLKMKPSPSSIEGVSKALSRNLESRRNSTSSRKGLPFSIGGGGGSNRNSALVSETNSLRAVPSETPIAVSPASQHPAPPMSASPPKKQQMLRRTVVITEPNSMEASESCNSAGDDNQNQNQEVRHADIDKLVGP